MKRVFLYALLIGFGAVCALRADENVRTVQSRLKAGGFYSGETNGVYNSDTAAAVTRYQIRNGLQITGKLDSQTRNALGVAGDEREVPTPKLGEDVWRYLRKSDQEYIKRLISEDARSVPSSKLVANANRTPGPTPSPARLTPTAKNADSHGPAMTKPSAPAATLPPGYDHERLHDYIGAFVLAGLDPEVGSEAEFFADRVNYFGAPNVSREKIRRDLQRYDSRWPERRFWLAGELEVSPVKNQLRVGFPLRYELRSGSRRSSGKVWKTLLLEKTSDDDLQIVAVNERKSR
ncbi:MAG TPA: peptidoglycan-binding domain-containing protein [Chthoniobacterales bacterium]|nr:peptidoglycan-binding domain-containing protein [Chthoniobacterales bacterium]